MITPNVQVRRANIEDLPKLATLWQQDNLTVEGLEKRFKEFQVATGPGGEILGALGFLVAGREAMLHSEVFTHFDQAEGLRDLLWTRAQTLAANHGVVRVWTQLAVPFWHTNGFQAAPAALLAKIPGTFAGDSHPWLFLQLKEETTPAISIEKEFAMFKEAEQERTQKIYRQAKVLKLIAALVAVAVMALVVIWAIFFFKAQARLPR